jgi:hypothetical protein
MPLNLVSPGVKTREVDLTIGGITAANDQVGAIAGPFQKGPVNIPIEITTEQDLVNTFGKPISTDNQYEYWMGASTYLSYGGILRVIRTDDTYLNTANSAVSAASTTLKIKSYDDYVANHSSPTSWNYAAKDPGTWANNLKVCVIDASADQRIAIGTFGLQVGYGMTVGFTTSVAGVGIASTTSGFVRGLITNIGSQFIDVKITDRFDSSSQSYTKVNYSPNSVNSLPQTGVYYFRTNLGVSTSVEVNRFTGSISTGSTVINPPFGAASYSSLTGVSTGVVLYAIDNLGVVNNLAIAGFGSTAINGYTQTTILLSGGSSGVGTNIQFAATKATTTGINVQGDVNGFSVSDWYNQQTLGLTNSTVYWKSIAEKPGTSQYSLERSGANDEIHFVVIDDTGNVSGVAGNILEKHLHLSKALDGRISPSQSTYYKDFIALNSSYFYAGAVPPASATGFTSFTSNTTTSTQNWGNTAQGTAFSGIGNKVYSLTGGVDYGTNGSSGGMNADLSQIISSYELLRNPAEYSINFLINGPSSGNTIYEAQAKANQLISIAEDRKDCIAVISPFKGGVVNVTNSDTQTQNIINFFSPITSSSYAVFDSGYKYTFDRFNNQFRYIACNADVAGLMARTSINQFPWFSPAGSARGALNNAVKLAYNPSQNQRDLLYPNRINPIVFSPGAGIILFGDKTGLSYASAFDRINVRRLFLTIEETIQRAARAQLFEFNDVITRSNFVNIVEPYLRDVKTKRGISDFLVICDETNNTPAVIDSNQFKADIYVKPARSINFIGLTFVATRTGVSFQEIVGNV